ncbi:DHHA1 domain-containing protein [Bacillus sp. REN3]|uniref:alanyl-tRNA editing protein n=1 Tax=Bacillus sp. REN3 TaxID=2802440 RepID=UPI001AEDD146|nr:DHHA1 domain-containing protein [Bacillus sp. REN3]
MEEKLYYQDPYLKSFSAKIMKEGLDHDGRRYVVLSQTAFYPTGGGQPSDTGKLNGIEVTEVEETEGEIRHYIRETLNGASLAEGMIDWVRRFDHMQQHSGQHILSAAFEQLFDHKTVSFHLGKDTLTIDLMAEQLSKEEAEEAEKLANELILENRPIECKWVSKGEVAQYQLRKELSVSEDIRLVIIPDFDYNGCGGTHPSSTGQVGLLKILGWEKQKKKVRVEFICGNRVLTQLGQKHAILRQLASLLNMPEQGMPEAVERLLDHRKELEKSLEETNDQLITYEAKELLMQKSYPAVCCCVYQDRSIQELQKLARKLVSLADDHVFLLAAENGSKLQFVFAKGREAEGDMKELAGKALPAIHGKGGGTELFAQGGGELRVPGEEFLSKVKKSLNHGTDEF